MYSCKSGKISPIDSRDMVDTKLSRRRRRRRTGSILKLICPPSPLVGGHNCSCLLKCIGAKQRKLTPMFLFTYMYKTSNIVSLHNLLIITCHTKDKFIVTTFGITTRVCTSNNEVFLGPLEDMYKIICLQVT